MSKVLNECNLHQIIVEILTVISADETEYLLTEAKHSKEYDSDVGKYLLLCSQMASDLRRKPHCYDTLDLVCKAIVTRQKNKDKVYKKDYSELLGMNYPIELNRIEKKVSPLQLVNIQNICKGFQNETMRYFWENQLLSMFPYIKESESRKKVAHVCLSVLCQALNVNLAKRINEKLSESTRSYWKLFVNETLKGKINPSINTYLELNTLPSLETIFGPKPPYQLYTIINAQVKKTDMTIQKIAEDELGITLNTWYDWKKEWEKMELDDEAELPKKRLSRIRLLVLAVLFDFTYSETVVFLATAGCRFCCEEPDQTVIQYMNKIEGAKSKGEVKEFLRSYMFQCSNW